MKSKVTSNLKHVVVVLRHLKGGGTEFVCLSLIDHLLKAKIRVDLVLLECVGDNLDKIPSVERIFALNQQFSKEATTNFMENLPDSIKFENLSQSMSIGRKLNSVLSYFRIHTIPQYFFTLPRLRYISAAMSLANYLEKEQPNLVIVALTHSQISSLIARKISTYHVPIICSIHAPVSHESASRKRWLKHLLSDADLIHVVSEGMKDDLIKLIPKVDGKVVNIPSFRRYSNTELLARQPVDHPWFTDSETSSNKPKLLLAVGRLEPQKNFSLLIDAFSKIHQRTNARLVILGEGKLRQKLQKQIRKLNLENFISMPGWKDNPYAYMSRSNLFVLSSVREGFPIVMLEALACGLPIVSTDCPSGGPREILKNGKLGRLVPVDDSLALAEAVVVSLSESVEKLALIKRALEFSPERVLPKYMDMLHCLIDA